VLVADSKKHCSIVFDSDENKTKMLSNSNIAQQKKLFCCNTHVCYQKNNLVQERQKMMTSNVWHCFCT